MTIRKLKLVFYEFFKYVCKNLKRRFIELKLFICYIIFLLHLHQIDSPNTLNDGADLIRLNIKSKSLK